MHFYEKFYGFHALRTVDKCTSRHLFRYDGLCRYDGHDIKGIAKRKMMYYFLGEHHMVLC